MTASTISARTLNVDPSLGRQWSTPALVDPPCGRTVIGHDPLCGAGQAAYQANGWGRAGPTDWKTCHRQGTSGTATASLSTSHSAPQGTACQRPPGRQRSLTVCQP